MAAKQSPRGAAPGRASATRTLPRLAKLIASCTACPRLVSWREEVARTKRRAYKDDVYWGRPVPGFGDASARIIIIGLAPGAHGANRTGRAFTGDRSGDFLYGALHRAGLASQPTSEAINDGLVLCNVYITMPCRCVPPQNKPTPEELRTCAPFLERELTLLTERRVILALGGIAYAAATRSCPAAPRFAHGASCTIDDPGGGPRQLTLFGSYHVSQQNTQTGRLTPEMFDRVLGQALVAARDES